MVTFIGNAAWDTWVSVATFPAQGRSAAGQRLGEGPGGTVANSAAQAVRSGASARLIATVGRDEAGRRVRAAIAEAAVELTCVDVDVTTQVTIFLDGDGKRTMIYFDDHSPDPGRCALEQVEGLAWIDVASDHRRGLWAERCTGRRGLPLKHVSAERRAGRTWPLVAGSLKGAPAPSSEDLQAIGCQLCVATAGERGAQIWMPNAGGTGHWRPIRTTPVDAAQFVDSAGASDAFLGAMLAALDQGAEIEEALQCGSAAGALAVQRRGAWPGPLAVEPRAPTRSAHVQPA